MTRRFNACNASARLYQWFPMQKCRVWTPLTRLTRLVWPYRMGGPGECRGSGDRKCSCNSLLTCNRFYLFLWWHFCVLSSLPVSREKRDLVGSAMYAQAPFGHNNMAAAVQCSFHHHHWIMFHIFHYSTSPKTLQHNRHE